MGNPIRVQLTHLALIFLAALFVKQACDGVNSYISQTYQCGFDRVMSFHGGTRIGFDRVALAGSVSYYDIKSILFSDKDCYSIFDENDIVTPDEAGFFLNTRSNVYVENDSNSAAVFPQCYLKLKKELDDQTFDLKNVNLEYRGNNVVNDILGISIAANKFSDSTTNITAIHLKTKNNKHETNLAYTAIILSIISAFVYAAYCIFRASVTSKIFLWLFITHGILDFIIFCFVLVLSALYNERRSGNPKHAGCSLQTTYEYFGPLSQPNYMFISFNFVTLRFFFYFLYMLPAFPGYAKDDYVPAEDYANIDIFENPPLIRNAIKNARSAIARQRAPNTRNA